jgi:hypothetical protein
MSGLSETTSPFAPHFVVVQWLSLRVVSAQPVRSMGQTESSV